MGNFLTLDRYRKISKRRRDVLYPSKDAHRSPLSIAHKHKIKKVDVQICGRKNYFFVFLTSFVAPQYKIWSEILPKIMKTLNFRWP